MKRKATETLLSHLVDLLLYIFTPCPILSAPSLHTNVRILQKPLCDDHVLCQVQNSSSYAYLKVHYFFLGVLQEEVRS